MSSLYLSYKYAYILNGPLSARPGDEHGKAMMRDLRERGLWLARNILPHEPAIRARLSRLYINDLDIDDIIQEMYTRILAVAALDAIRYPRQYAIQTAKSIIIDHIRRSRVVTISLSGNLDQLDIPDPEPSVEKHLEFLDEIQGVAHALAQLPKRPRETLILRRVEKLSRKETARRLNISERTVEDHMTRALCMLMDVFGRGGGKSKAHSSIVTEITTGSTGSKNEAVRPGN
jgi:RNA polymerase sigma factor (sigma-70 family)